jgi:hypothetical protein
LEIHKPKPSHSLSEFAIELFTIVVGIVIALGLEQAVDSHHWHQKAETARDSIKVELRSDAAFYQFRIQVNECVARRLKQLNDIAEDVAARRRVETVGDLTIHLGHVLTDDAWQAEKSAQTAAHFSVEELQQYSLVYAQQTDIRVWMNQETYVWAALRLLEGDPMRLAASDLTVVRNNIQVARSLNRLIAVNAVDQLDRISKLGVAKVTVDEEWVRASCMPLKRTAPAVPYTNF